MSENTALYTLICVQIAPSAIRPRNLRIILIWAVQTVCNRNVSIAGGTGSLASSPDWFWLHVASL